MFFCDATSTEWQNEQYELFHARLKELHQTMKIPYFYVEWRAALRKSSNEQAKCRRWGGAMYLRVRFVPCIAEITFDNAG